VVNPCQASGSCHASAKPRSTDRPSVAALASVFHFAVGLLVDWQSIGGGLCASKQRCSRRSGCQRVVVGCGRAGPRV